MKVIPYILHLVIILAFVMMFQSCTISLSNISTHGVASDVMDEDQQATADVKPVIDLTPGLI